VAAASVIAKVERDNLVAAMAARYFAEFGPLRGGGYVNDGTRTFVRAYVATYGVLPPEARRSWPWTDVGLGSS
jgi:ribonuclease HII